MLREHAPDPPAPAIGQRLLGQRARQGARAMIQGWPSETLQSMIALYERGDSVKEIALALDKTPHSIISKVSFLAAQGRVELRQPPFRQEEKDRLLREYDAAAATGTLDDLAKSMGRTKQFLCRKAGELGLTSQNRPMPYMSEGCSRRTKAWHSANPHPRGMAGKFHTDATKLIVARASKERWEAMTEDQRSDQLLKAMKTKVEKYGSLATPRYGTTWKSAWRTIGGKTSFFRSSWEANYARYLEWLKVHKQIYEWEHEPKTFWFEAIRRGVRSFLPDFRVTENDGRQIYHEVKGWMDDASKTKIKRMAIYHPEIKLIVVEQRAYYAIAKQVGGMILDWEVRSKPDDSQGDFFRSYRPARVGRAA